MSCGDYPAAGLPPGVHNRENLSLNFSKAKNAPLTVFMPGVVTLKDITVEDPRGKLKIKPALFEIKLTFSLVPLEHVCYYTLETYSFEGGRRNLSDGFRLK
jgi:hypothetical protein